MKETQEMWVPSLSQEDPLQEGMTMHSSILAWRISWTEGPSGLQTKGLQRVRHNWNDLAYTQKRSKSPEQKNRFQSCDIEAGRGQEAVRRLVRQSRQAWWPGPVAVEWLCFDGRTAVIYWWKDVEWSGVGLRERKGSKTALKCLAWATGKIDFS